MIETDEPTEASPDRTEGEASGPREQPPLPFELIPEEEVPFHVPRD
ncbi:MAG TPA: hypothetical protein VMS56_09425 [Thermoanaerobaculia bacterium]|nr:hypothetical protein [Thermoanaerobaculia bacterium]